MSRAPCSPSTEPPAPKGPQASAPSLNIVQQRRRAVCINCRQRAFFCYERETMSQYFGSERGTVSPRTSLRKLRPVLNADSGKWFPQRVSRGKRVPLWTPIPGHRFPTAPVSETTSRFEPSKRDATPLRDYRLLTVVVLGFIARVELQHAAAVFAHGELGALQAAALTRSQLGRVDLVAIGLLG